jgi:GT2 family glycosyltransferase
MMEFSQQEEIGVVGAKLLSQNAEARNGEGVFFRSLREGAEHLLRRHPSNMWRSNDYSWDVCNPAAVSKGGMMFRKSTFLEVGALDESLSGDQDVDFCRRVRRAGYRIVWTPWARFFVDEARVVAARPMPSEKWLAGRLATEEEAL